MRQRNFLDSKKDLILMWISENKSFSFMCQQLQVARDTLRNYIRKINPEYKGNQSSKGCTRKRKTALEIIGEPSVSNSKKRNRLIEDGIKENKCERCGLSEWMNQPIPLELHHIDFNHYNNSLENLMIVCSNCHMQLHGYSNNRS